MSLAAAPAAATVASFPRVSGDEPFADQFTANVVPFSPRERG